MTVGNTTRWDPTLGTATLNVTVESDETGGRASLPPPRCEPDYDDPAWFFKALAQEPDLPGLTEEEARAAHEKWMPKWQAVERQRPLTMEERNMACCDMEKAVLDARREKKARLREAARHG